MSSDTRILEILGESQKRAARQVFEEVGSDFLELRREAESPIEEMLLAALVGLRHQAGSIIVPQFEIGPYRADILYRFAATTSTHSVDVVVECDGHDFHEKTKEQAKRDKRRDRYIVAQGYPVMRFTGREVYRDPHKCAREIEEFALEEHIRRFESAAKQRGEALRAHYGDSGEVPW